MPAADRFDGKEGDPPVVRGYRVDGDSGEETLVGYAFLTSDLPPEEKGYNGPIEVLVGLDTAGTVTGVRVTRYRESLRETRGDFLRRPGFQEQFEGKDVDDPFRLGRDVDGISGATITVDAMSRGIRRAVRRVAAAHLWSADDGSAGPDLRAGSVSPEELDRLSLPEMLARGFLRRLVVLDGDLTAVELTVGYLRDRSVGELLLGSGTFARALEEAGEPDGVVGNRHLLLLGVDGALSALFRPSAVWIVQETDSLRLSGDDVAMLGEPRSGRTRGEFREVGVAFVEGSLDLGRPFTVALDLRPGMPLAELRYPAPSPPVTAARSPADEATTPDAPAPETASAAAEGEPSAPDRSGSVPGPAPADEGAEDPDPDPSPSTGGTDEARPSDDDAGDAPDPDPAGAAEEAPVEVEALAPGPDVPPAARSAAPEIPLEAPGEDGEESALARTVARTSWTRVAGTLLVLALASAAFAAKRRPRLRGAALGATLLYLGFVDGGFLSVSHITSVLQVGPGVFLADLPLLLLVGFTAVTTLLWGRVFCGYLCPFGALQDLLDRVVPDRLRQRLPRGVHEPALLVKYGLLAVILVPAAAGASVSVFQYVEPFGTVFFLSRSTVLWVIAGGVLVACAVVPRFYCRYACPLGAALAVGSTLSPFRIRRVEQCTVCTVCEQSCPTGAIHRAEVDFRECVRCNVCERKLLERAGTCAHEMETVRSRLIQLEVPERER